MTSGTGSETFVAEVLRINDRFNREVVEGLDVCPFARGARAQGRVAREVLLQSDLDELATVALIAQIEADPREPEVALLIYPRMTVTPREFEHFNARLRERLGLRPARPKFVHAVFHPDFPCDRRTPDSLVSFFRKSPDPTIQLVRHSTIESVRGDTGKGTMVVDPRKIDWTKLDALLAPSITDKITNDNYARVTRDGPAPIEAILADIRADRDASYARFTDR